MPAAKNVTKLNLQFLLDSVDIPSLHKAGLHSHLLTTELVWPRLGVARKSAVLTVPLTNGLCATDVWSYTQKVVLKESCEHLFGIRVSLSETLTSAKMRKFLRYLAGKTADLAADAVEDAIPVPIADEIASLPLLYLSKQLLTSQDPDLIVEGTLDLDISQFPADGSPVTITVPLVTQHTRYAPTTRTHGPHDVPLNSRRKIISEKGSPDGTAVFTVSAF